MAEGFPGRKKRLWPFGAREEAPPVSGDYSQMRFIPGTIDRMELTMAGRTPLSPQGASRRIFDSKDGERFYSSDSHQWAAYELLNDFLEINPVVYSKKYGFLSWQIPRAMFTEKPEEVPVGDHILSLVFNDSDHFGHNVAHSPQGHQRALFDTEQVRLFWDGIRPTVMKHRLDRSSRAELEALANKAREMRAYFSSEEGRERVESVFAGKGVLPETIRPFSRPHEDKGSEEFRQEMLRRLAIIEEEAGRRLAERRAEQA